MAHSSPITFDLGELGLEFDMEMEEDPLAEIFDPETDAILGNVESNEPENKTQADLAASIDDYIASKQNIETTKKTRRDMAKLEEYLLKKGEIRSIEKIPPAELCVNLADYFIHLKKQDGDDFEPSTINGKYSSIKRYLDGKKYKYNLTTSSEFSSLRQVLATKKKDLKENGKGNLPNRAEMIEMEEEEKMWEAGALGSYSPTTLRNTVWFMATKCLGMRGRQESRQLKLGDLTEGCDNQGNRRLIGNNIKTIPANAFNGLRKLTSLHLQQNQMTRVPSEALRGLSHLEQLELDDNHIQVVPADSFETLTNLTMLWLESNNLTTLPVAALNKVPTLAALTLALNSIRSVPNQAFVNMTNLAVLLLNYNHISEIGDYAFEGLRKLKMLELKGNKLKGAPVALQSLPRLQELDLTENEIEYLHDDSFAGNKELILLQIKKNPIHSVGRYTFTNLPKLDSLILPEARDQIDFPDLSGTYNLVTLSLDRGNIKFIPNDLCNKLKKLKSFDIHSNAITVISNLSGCRDLRTLNLGNNGLMSLSGQPFKGLSQLRDLTLSHNLIQVVPEDAFTGLTQLQYLDLQHNRIDVIARDTFAPLQNLEDLNLGDNMFSVLPTKGLENLKNLKTFGNKRLKDFPPPETFPRIQLLTLSYAYHCCEFIKEEEPENQEKQVELKEDITWLSKDPDNAFWRNLTNIWGPLENISHNYQGLVEKIWDNFGTEYSIDYPEHIPRSAANYFDDYRPRLDAEDIYIARPPVMCKPMPGPFMPCDDLMGWWSLRCGVWIVFLLALLGNGTVLLVSVAGRTKIDVPRFLICNLACADFFMGVYLGFLAIVDASTLGEFKKHAIKWQTSLGCQVAGFLGVLSSELSVFTLTLITLERFYAITHAMHLNKRLSLRHAGYIMACGWFLALLLASMPLFGVSDYRKFAICLPFEISDTISLGYVCFIMFLNCLAFGIIVSCYTKMYCSIRGSQAWNSNDSRVAKRMALLVFTDFACWAPISFFSLTAAFGFELISLNDAKVFTIFVLPLNSCANPFLYAIFTKQFKKDCAQICKRLEESAMSRSLSRLSNRNLSVSWGSSRRPSLLNSFFNIDKRFSRSNSISGASAAQLENGNDLLPPRATINTGGSTGRASIERNVTDAIIANGSANPIRRVHHKKSCCFYNAGDDNEGILVNGSYVPLRCSCYRNTGSLRNSPREAPVGAGSALLSLIRHKRGQDKLGDGADSDQEDAAWMGREGHPVGQNRDTLGLFPLLPLGESPGGARRPRDLGPRNDAGGRQSPRGHSRSKSKSPSPNGIKKIALNCCNSSPHEATCSPGAEYQLMRPADESSFDTDGLPTIGGEQSSSDMDHSLSMNNNHEYVNITEDMINELQRIRNSSTSPPDDSSETSHGMRTQPASPQSETRSTHEVNNTNSVRPDPEGSESKDKPSSVVKLTHLPPLPKRVCRCSQPYCKDKHYPVGKNMGNLNRWHSMDNSHLCQFSGPGCGLSRELWLSSTEHVFSQAKKSNSVPTSSSPPPPQSQALKRECLKKSGSLENDHLLQLLPRLNQQASSSLPGLENMPSSNSQSDVKPASNSIQDLHTCPVPYTFDETQDAKSVDGANSLGCPSPPPTATAITPATASLTKSSPSPPPPLPPLAPPPCLHTGLPGKTSPNNSRQDLSNVQNSQKVTPTPTNSGPGSPDSLLRPSLPEGEQQESDLDRKMVTHVVLHNDLVPQVVLHSSPKESSKVHI